MDPKRIIDMASAFYESCVLFTATDQGIFDALAENPSSTCPDLAAKCGLNERGTRLLLDACVAVGLLIKEDETYSNAPETAALLVTGSPGDLTQAIRYNRDVYNAWGRLPVMVKTGRPVEEPAMHLGADKERTRQFVMAMHGRALGIGRAVVPGLDLGGCSNLLDAGGGPGTYSMMIAQRHPGITCTVMDLPEVVEVADELIKKHPASDRIKTFAGDYHTAKFPSGQDAVLFFGVLHQETPASIEKLLEKAYGALNPGGTVHVLDMMTDSTHTAPKFSALFAVNMALTTDNGWVFSDAELSDWLTGAGFRDINCEHLPPPMPHWLVSGRKEGES